MNTFHTDHPFPSNRCVFTFQIHSAAFYVKMLISNHLQMEDFGSYKLCRISENRIGRRYPKTLCAEGCAPFASTGINSYINFYAPMKSFINMGGAFKRRHQALSMLPSFTQRKVSNEPPKPP